MREWLVVAEDRAGQIPSLAAGNTIISTDKASIDHGSAAEGMPIIDSIVAFLIESVGRVQSSWTVV